MTKYKNARPLTDLEMTEHLELVDRCRKSSTEARGVVAKSRDALKDFRSALEKARAIKAYARRRGVEMGWKDTRY